MGLFCVFIGRLPTCTTIYIIPTADCKPLDFLTAIMYGGTYGYSLQKEELTVLVHVFQGR